MRLADYLAAQEIKDAVFAERIGVSRQTLWRYKSGDRRPEWDVLERIAQETHGEVTPNDFLQATADAVGLHDAEPAPHSGEAA
ncbi:transcriptional regulator [Methylobacterium sp. E-041]|uniref:helix-turn-helix domain-containing protein n=1 Tax=Methylobacterium sp. E-041 TaxID=2836573 RepID=UPI001FB8E8B6|nr:helix-turn-helix domain-containing protein [Methylobacterium sp. E-041]MCJ2104725.1 transcriptional regulator [Methylobacterium sp. E-041]